MRIIVFGKSGQVATELARRAPDARYLGRDEADLTDPAGCAAAIRAARPDAVINAAAYTAVDRAEEEEAAATTINGTAPGAMAGACADLDIPLVHISTDYVFDGTGSRPWHPADPTGPINAYGRSKLAGEEALRAAGGRHVILRTSWVFSAQGANFVKTMLRLAESHDHLRVVADQIGGPTPAGDIAAACLTLARALHEGATGGTHHFAGAEPASWAGFARETFARAGQDVTVEDITTEAWPTPAKRPLNSRLDCGALMRDFGIAAPDWRDGLAKVIAELKGR
ncbi:MAG: dTDP-4-dehydrorhamnose reductase [Pseudorhodobacter sp.]